MTGSDRWQQVSQIFEAALSLEPEARVAYLKARCGADDSLRREVELLIQSQQKASAENFMSGHAFERAAPVLAASEAEAEERKPRLADGQAFGDYRVIQKIGAGGMGEVYLAKDTRLDRTVALKILPADVAFDQRRMLRFKQEAKIASALNQPNILTIFEVGETDSLHFIATEYVDGETLRQHLGDKQIKLVEIIDIAIQVTAALDAAHEAKIVHRDIKPENIMIRQRDGLVKVLDFGLAKLTESGVAPGQATDTEAATEMLLKTMPGSVMGTINYMSPEQAQGLQVDARTDIWSSGVVLYEMVAGHTPFSGPTSSHTVVQILEREPATLAQSAQQRVPPELERIVSKALAKNVEERYQTTKDLLIDLKNLRRRLEVEAELERSMPPPFAARAPTDESIRTTDKDLQARATAGDVIAASSDSNAPIQSSSRKTLLPIFIGAAVLVGLLIVGFSVWSSSRSSVLPPAPAPASERQLNYWMTVQKYRAGKPFQDPFRLAREINFEKDYRVRFGVSSPQVGHLYILNEGPAPTNQPSSFVILFPSSTANTGSAILAENQEIQIPQQSWFRFDGEAGTEKLWFVFSANAVPELEAVRRFANTADRGLVSSADLNHRVREFFRKHSESKAIVEQNEEREETSLKSKGTLLIHLVLLEHH